MAEIIDMKMAENATDSVQHAAYGAQGASGFNKVPSAPGENTAANEAEALKYVDGADLPGLNVRAGFNRKTKFTSSYKDG